ncbi:twin-arginine translocase TatA/TatE family subunit [Kitasatospora sp. NPDC094011]|uniref:twin-arginine translocase TatA/TatE family subunit n=1 Tax=Kitasatospora sp. NPDC094011 TaxID=3364090 RepID=UPI00381A39F3
MFRTRGLEIVIVGLVVLVLFGAKRLPDSARALGKSLRILKAETNALKNDDAHPRRGHQRLRPAAGGGRAGGRHRRAGSRLRRRAVALRALSPPRGRERNKGSP